jgi:toxin ParE1/3/4
VDFKIELSPEAIENLAEIAGWIARDDPVRAESFGNELLDRLEVLRDFPEIGSVYSKEPATRKLVTPPYLIVYRVMRAARKIEIITFRHTSRDRIP